MVVFDELWVLFPTYEGALMPLRRSFRVLLLSRRTVPMALPLKSVFSFSELVALQPVA